MNKAELIKAVASKTDTTQQEAKISVEAVIDAIKDALISNEQVAVLGFGTFSVDERPAREGFNPLKKEKIQIPAKKIVRFKAGEALNSAL